MSSRRLADWVSGKWCDDFQNLNTCSLIGNIVPTCLPPTTIMKDVPVDSSDNKIKPNN